MLRRPAVAGAFYPGDAESLRRQVDGCLPAPRPAPAIATLAPHAGYAYSGRVAGTVYASVAIPAEVVLVSFSHRGVGAPFAVWPDGEWETPLGRTPVAQSLCGEILRLRGFSADTGAFLREHSGEVQLPFLQRLRAGVNIAPLSIQSHDPAALRDAARALAALLGGRDILLAATTDLTHCGEDYGQIPPAGTTAAEFARRQDGHILKAIASLDTAAFWRALRDHEITMCGVAPTALMMEYALARGARSAEVLLYATSADDEPGADRAVGYPGVVVR